MIYSFMDISEILKNISILSKYEKRLLRNNGLLDQEMAITLKFSNKTF